MLQNHFNIKRFYKALKYDIRLNAKTYSIFIVSFLLGLLLLDLFFIISQSRRMPFGIDELNASRWFYYFDYSNYIPLFYLAFILGITIVAGTSFPFLRHKKSTINYLMFPASTLEKFLIQFVIRILVYMLLFMPLFWLVFKLTAGIYNSFEWEMPVKIDNFNIFSPFTIEKLELRSLDILVIICSLFSLSAFLFAGATYFNKKALPKTIFSFALSVLSLFLFFAMSTAIFYPEKFNFSNRFIFLNDYRISGNLFNTQLFFYVLGIVCSLFLLPLAYFKLKEKEI